MRAHRCGKTPDTMRSVEMRKRRSEALPKTCRRAEDALPDSTPALTPALAEQDFAFGKDCFGLDQCQAQALHCDRPPRRAGDGRSGDLRHHHRRAEGPHRHRGAAQWTPTDGLSQATRAPAVAVRGGTWLRDEEARGLGRRRSLDARATVISMLLAPSVARLSRAALPNCAVLGSRRLRCAPPLARRQRRAQPWEARPAHAGPFPADTPGQSGS